MTVSDVGLTLKSLLLLTTKFDATLTLTARTRSSEVFPAFCKPTIVTSISVALEKHRKVSKLLFGER
jgi:hypothetical protein